MLASAPISRKIAIAFAGIVLAVLAMMGVLWWSLQQITDTTAGATAGQEITTQALAMELAVQRQNSQSRGFLITADPIYLKQYRDSIAEQATVARRLDTLLADDPAMHAAVDETVKRTAEWRRTIAEPMIVAGQHDRAAGLEWMRTHSKTARVSFALEPLLAVRAQQARALDAARAAQSKALAAGTWSLILGGIAMLGVAIGASVLLSRLLARPIVRLTGVMKALAEGNNAISVPDATREDELGSMSRAVLVFRDAAVAKATADAEQARVVEEVGHALQRLADADLCARIDGFPASYAKLERDFNLAVERLGAAMNAIRDNAGNIRHATAAIGEATDDLAHRAEQQAASLEETSAAMSEITHAVQAAARDAAAADDLVRKAAGHVGESSEIVQRTVTAIADIERSSQEIAEIISVIDGLSFQTNLLALNAGVEAARAGEAGKGFAVVASEVRALAERSADAARDISRRITATVERVRNGVTLAGETHSSLGRVSESMTQITQLVNGISRNAGEQATSIQQINVAVADMDGVTQSNAAKIEESTAAVRQLGGDTDGLVQQIDRFRVPQDGHAAPRAAMPVAAPRIPPAAPRRAAAPVVPLNRPARAPAPMSHAALPLAASAAQPRVAGNLAVKLDQDDDDWSQF